MTRALITGTTGGLRREKEAAWVLIDEWLPAAAIGLPCTRWRIKREAPP